MIKILPQPKVNTYLQQSINYIQLTSIQNHNFKIRKLTNTDKQLTVENERKLKKKCAEIKPQGIYPKRKSLVMP